MRNNWRPVAAFIFLAALIGSALIFRYCTPLLATEPIVEPPVERAEPLTGDVLYIRSPEFHEARTAILAGDADVSEAYLMEHIHANWAKNIVNLFDHVYTQCGIKSVNTHNWPNDNTVTVYMQSKDGKLAPLEPYTVKFSNVHYDPELTSFNYGKTQISQQLPAELSGHAYLFDLTKDEAGGTFEQTDSVTLEQHRETSISKSVEMNYTLSSETTIGGSFYGVSLEEKLTATFGKAFKEEESQAEGESKSKTEEHKFDVELEPLKATLVTLESVEVHSSTPFTIDGVPDWEVEIRIPRACLPDPYIEYVAGEGAKYNGKYNQWWQWGPMWFTHPDNLDWCRSKDKEAHGPPDLRAANIDYSGHCTLTFGKDGSAIEELVQLFTGKHVRWPGMHAYGFKDGWVEHSHYCHDDCRDSWHGMHEPEYRHLELTGTQHRVYEDTIKETISDVTGQDLDAVAREHSAERPPYNPKD